ncbi:MAG: molybdate ABC transporter substrate-binding protein [Caulobacteraceae bacterium]
MMDRLRRGVLLALALAAAVSSASVAAHAGPLVFAAASLREAMNEAADSFAATGAAKPVVSFAGSSTLAKQIENGAPADLFVSADEAWMDYLAEKKLIVPASRAPFLSNKLVLIAPAGQPLKVDIKRGFPLAKLLGDGRLAMADPNSVPAGRYGKAALIKLGAWPAVEAKVAQAEDVRAALTFVERGEARAGIVYSTDAQASQKVTVVGVVPAGSHPPISYPLALVAGRSNADAAKFRAYLLSAKGKAIFAKHGFTVK